MAKKKRSYRSFLNTQTIFKWLRIAALVAPAAGRALGGGTPQDKVRAAIMDYTGYNWKDGSWKWERMKRGWMPFVTTTLITVGISKLTGLIRRFK